jgi:hypothetical protein
MRRPWSIWARAMWWMHLLISVFVVLVKCDCGSGWRMPAPWCPPCGACEWASDGGPARAHRHRVPGRIPGRLVPHPAWPAAIAGARRASVRIGHTGAALPTRLVGSCWDQSQSEAGLAAAQAVLTNLGNQKDIARATRRRSDEACSGRVEVWAHRPCEAADDPAPHGCDRRRPGLGRPSLPRHRPPRRPESP